MPSFFYLLHYLHMQHKLIGIGGVSASGKSTLAENLEAANVGVRFRFDAYYKDEMTCPRTNGRVNWDLPESLHLDDVYRDLLELKHGRAIQMPVYERGTTNARVGTVLFEPAPILLVEGIFLFTDARIRSLFDLKVWIDLSEEEALRRRMERQPNYDPTYHHECLWPGMERYVLPYRSDCDAVLDGTQSRDTLMQQARQLIESYAIV